MGKTANMEDIIEINNKAKAPVLEKSVEKKILKALDFLRKEKITDFEKKVDFSVAFVSKKEMAGLNLKYRKKNEPTDILSFSYGAQNNLCGEIVLCYDVIEKNAKESEIEACQELGINIVHGILHIAGFEHGKEMFKLQEKISSKI